MTSPIEGVKVVDLSRFIAGPFCGLLLADMGAEVIKVEKPGGEDSRHLPPFVEGDSLYTAALNRNKRAITLNYRHPRAKEVLTRLFKWADIVVENFRPGTMEEMGFGPEQIKQINPRVILVRSSGFGQSGPMRHRPGFDAIAQAMSGLMSMTGRESDPPLLAGTFVADYATGIYAALGAVAALHYRQMTGEGQVVDVSLFESAVSMLVSAIPAYFLTGALPPRSGNRDRFAAPCNAYRARDGWIYLACSNNGLWARLCGLMGRTDLLEAPHLQTPAMRLQHVDELDTIVGDWVANDTVDELVKILDEAGLPCAPVWTIDRLISDPHLRERGQIVDVEHPTAGTIPLSGVTIKFSRTPGAIRYGPPLVGQHNAEVYMHELGYEEGEWNQLKEEGVY